MIKRMNKATSLLIVAAAVIFIMPTTGIYAADKLETKEGTIQSAVAFDDGKYIYDGYKTEDDDTGVYYNAGDADKQLETFDSDSITKFSDKYAKLIDGSDEYLVDLSTGKVSDETTQDIMDTAKVKLKSNLTKTDRYGNVSSTDDITLDQVAQGQFGEVWYSYVTKGAVATHSGYVNEAGKYIDTDYIANMYVSNGTKTVKIEEFDKLDTDNKIKVDLVSAKTIAQDNDYIYRIVNVNITKDTTVSTAAYIQAISKAQGTQQDDAYLPNTVTSYEISSAYDSEDADNAKTTLNDTNTTFRVINGVIYATKNNGSTVTVTTIKLKKDKVTLDDTTTTTNKLDVYLAEQDVQKDQDISGEKAVSIDADGNTWATNDGKIFEFNGTKFNEVYTCDTGINSLDVYNEKSLIAWEDGKDIYITASNQATDTTTKTSTVTTGWVKATDGTWTYNKADGTKATGWVKDGSTWYYLNASGVMQTGWVKDGSTWYYLNGSGAMLANTVVDGYTLNASGAWVK